MTAAPALPSYASGVSDVPLLGDTIGDDADRTVARHGLGAVASAQHA